jgi:hypothetical protein
MTAKLTIGELWEQGVPHHPLSETIARSIAEIDMEQGDDYFCFKFGGDGDNGEHLMYLLDVYFADWAGDADTERTVVGVLMAKVQEYASTWSLVGGRFDSGDMLQTAEQCKAELQAMIEQALAGAAA